ncbi:MAG: YcjX family protein [Pseudomonadota bacterium]
MALEDEARAWLKRAGDWLPQWTTIEAGLAGFGRALLGNHLRVAVTGLSRSGKTVFVTCLAHHLERGTGLPFLEAVAERRYRGARIANRSPEGVVAFPYRAHSAALSADPPRWPAASTDLSLLRMNVDVKRKRGLIPRVGDDRPVTIDLVDYPGEWLIDLPLLRDSYDGWSSVTLERLRARPYEPFFRDFLQALDGADVPSLVSAYVGAMQAARAARLSLLHPGRALTPTAVDAPLEQVAFAPVPPGHRHAKAFGERFVDYVERWVRPFKANVVDAVDRQIVLVDVLESLNRGPPHFDDTRAALAMILESFNYGRGNRMQRWVAPKVERLVFCATKADHVANTQHANLKALLQDMVDDAARRVRLEGIATETLAVAALRSTDTVRTDHDGQRLSCVRGVLYDTGQERIIFPGEVPPTMPRGADWDEQRFAFRRFAPRSLAAAGNGGVQGHIRLDQVLESVLGDRLA